MIPAMKLNTFFKSFREIKENAGSIPIQQHLSKVRLFNEGFNQRFLDLTDHYKSTTPNYNLFSVLKINTLEAIVHTPFLAHLLNPDANHNQGKLFIGSFIREIVKIPVDDADILISEVRDEKVTGLGNIDIFIKGRINGKEIAIIIENKIYAGDQNKQLERYYRFLREHLAFKPNDIRIIYLTPYGKKPKINVSIRNCLLEVLEKRNILIFCNYHKNITEWLEFCLTQLDHAPIIKSTIQQYLLM